MCELYVRAYHVYIWYVCIHNVCIWCAVCAPCLWAYYACMHMVHCVPVAVTG